MPAGKIFAISFAINAMMGGSFGAVMNQSTAVMQRLRSQTTQLNTEQSRLSAAWEQSQKAARTYQTTCASLHSQLTAGKISQAQYEASVKRAEQAMRSASMSASEYRGHMARLKQEASQTQAKLQQFQNAVAARDQASARFASARAGFTETLTTVGMLAAPLIGAVNTAMTFESAMSKVAAITRTAGTPAIQELTDNARMLGETTQFSATQAAEAMSYLGMAGWNSEQIIAGMPGLLALAAAGGTDLARTADIVSDDLTAFGLSAEQASHMADVFAVTATRTNTNVEMIGETMKYAAPVARAFGATMEETAAMTGLMANAGVKSTQAGTALRAGFLRLAGPPKKSSKAMEELGISISDVTAQQEEAAAALKGLGIDMESISGTPSHKMVAILKELKDKTAGLSDEQKLATMQAIFGTEAATGWLNVLEAGPEVFESLVNEMENCDGEAEKMAAVMMNNAKGALTQLASAAESVAISIGSIFLPSITEAARGAASMAGDLSKWIQGHKELVKVLGSTAAGMSGALVIYKLYRILSLGFESAAASLKVYKLTLIETGTAATKTAVGQRVLTAATAAQARVMSLASAAANPETYRRLGQAAMETAARLRAITWAQIGQAMSSGIKGGVSSATGALSALKTNALATMAATRTAIVSSMGNIATKAAAAGQAVMNMARSFTIAGALQSATAGFRALGTAIMGIGKASLAAMFSPLGVAILAIAGAAYLIYANWERVGPFFIGLWERIKTAVADAWTMMQPAIERLKAAFSAMIDVIGPKLTNLGTVVMDAFQKISAAVSSNSGVFDVLANAALFVAEIFGGALITSFIFFANISVGVITTAIGVISSVITGIIGVCAGVIDFITGVFAGDWSKAWEGIKEVFASIFGTIGGIADSIMGGIQSTINGIIDSVKSAASSLPGLSGDGNKIASNASGGIYRKGAFLTTFAEEGPEAAIPLDGSDRAIGLWRMAGEILGVGGANAKSSVAIPSGTTTEQLSQTIAAPPIEITLNIYGENDPGAIRSAVEKAGQAVQRSFAEQMEQYNKERGRLAFG